MRMYNLTNKLLDSPIVLNIENKTNLNRKFILGIMYTFLLTIFYNFLGLDFIVNSVGFIYPAYYSFKSLNTKTDYDDKQWLIYWIVYSFITTLELFIGFIFYWIPFYYLLKLSFLLWLSHEKTQGAQFIYNNYLKQKLIDNEKLMDNSISIVNEKINNVINSVNDKLDEINSSDKNN